MLYVLGVVAVLLSVITYYVVFVLSPHVIGVYNVLSMSGYPDVEEEEDFTEEELSMMARQEDFDRRINRMHKEMLLAQASMINPKTGNIAEELDPSVHNLPHDSVNHYYDVNEEYAK